MITNINEFKKFLEDYQAKPGEKFTDMTPDQLKRLAMKKDDDTSIDSMATISKDDTSSTPKKNIKVMPGFKRILYNDADPKNIKSIDFGPLDVIFEMDIQDIGVYSNWLADKELNKQSHDGEPSKLPMDKHIKGEAIYYGWHAANDYSESYYFVTLTTLTNSNKAGFPFQNIHEIRSIDEMYDIVWALLDAIDDIRKNDYEMDLNPDTATNGRLSDEAEYFS